MSDHTDSVNEIVAYFARTKVYFKENDDHLKAAQHARWESALQAFLREYHDLEKMTRPIPTMGDDDLSDLPPELLKELSVTKTDDLENQIATIINAAGGHADIDTILIHLYRRFNVSQTRRFLQNKLWRMTNKNILFSISGKKGHYSTTKPTESEDEDAWIKFMDTQKINNPSLDDEHPHEDELDDDEIPF